MRQRQILNSPRPAPSGPQQIPSDVLQPPCCARARGDVDLRLPRRCYAKIVRGEVKRCEPAFRSIQRDYDTLNAQAEPDYADVRAH